MKLVLIQPPVRDFYDTEIRLQPLGLCYLKAAVRQHLPHVEVVVRDYHQGHGRRTVPIPDELSDLRAYYPYPDKSPFRTFHNYHHFGASFDELADEVVDEKPDIVGISTLFTPYHREALDVAAAIKRQLDVPVVMGGAHASAAPHSVLESPDVDFVIRGEGEKALVELLNALQSATSFEGIVGLGYKREGKPVLNDPGENFPIDDLAFPDFSDLDVDRYQIGRRPLAFLISSRGCPHRCTFCSVHQTFGWSYRRRSNKAILAEMKQRYGQGYRIFDFEDDNFTLDKKAVTALLHDIIEMYPNGDIELLAQNGLSYQSLDEEVLGLMKEAGFKTINISLVSANGEILKVTKRSHTVEKYLNVVAAAFRLGLKITSYQIMGIPGETLDSQIETLTLNARLPVLLGASPFYLTPGMPMAGNTVHSKRDMVRARLTALGPDPSSERRDETYTLFVTTRIIDFLKSAEFEEPELELKEVLLRFESAGGRQAIGAELLQRLLKEGVLYAATPQGLNELPRFRGDAFRKAWAGLSEVVTQDGRVVRVGSKDVR